MELNNEKKIIEIMTEIRDVVKKHDKGVRPTVILLLVMMAILIIVTYFK